jgi:hypothetical protein
MDPHGVEARPFAHGCHGSLRQTVRACDREAIDDALATSTTTNQAHMMHGIDQLAAGQEQLTREIAKLQEIEQHVRSKNSDHPLQSGPPQGLTSPTIRLGAHHHRHRDHHDLQRDCGVCLVGELVTLQPVG